MLALPAKFGNDAIPRENFGHADSRKTVRQQIIPIADERVRDLALLDSKAVKRRVRRFVMTAENVLFAWLCVGAKQFDTVAGKSFNVLQAGPPPTARLDKPEWLVAEKRRHREKIDIGREIHRPAEQRESFGDALSIAVAFGARLSDSQVTVE